MADYIRTLGPSRAYAAFSDAVRDKDYSQAHNAAHLFGAVLFDVKGLSAISTCDASYGFGCYHGFIIEAVAGRGVSVIRDLDAACKKTPQPTACEHGIGHGILEYLGHDHLKEALVTCDLTKPTDPIAGCRSGVFMEYNVPLVFDSESSAFVAARKAKQTSPVDPCPTLDAVYQPACYYGLPQWWQQAYGPDAHKMATFCATAPKALESDCALGIGTLAASMSHTDAQKAIGYCSAPLSQAAQFACLRAAAGAFISNAQATEKARVICEAISDPRVASSCASEL
jgi:hypothetical protein